MNKVLLDDIDAIIDKDLDNVMKSNAIMERLRGETIFIPKSYKDELEEKQLEAKKEKKQYPVTINPDQCLPIFLTQIENGSIDVSGLDLIKKGVIQIKANSFGPFFPEEYFNNDTKILWILKESFIEGPSYSAGDRGGHNQAAEYGYYFPQYNNLGSDKATHPRVLELTKMILISLCELSKTHERDLTKEVMKHICILEANHFPGLAFYSKKTKDGLIGKWAEKNAIILKELIEFYKPNILIGGNTIGNFYNIPKCGISSLKNSIENGNNKLLSKLGINVYRDCVEQPKGSSSFVFKASLGRDNKPIYVIDAYHPTKYKDAEAEADTKLIKEWMSKENGMIKSLTV
ncbi:MAG: hypothetical protein K2L17_09565 [Muribaculaceae bacterium]|nr:hypothetical protein [Muribaculaceae bacterium]